MIELVTAFTLGLLGSLHCIGMCGPLVLALPMMAKSKLSFVVHRMIYNFGKALTYGILGVMVGLFGNKLFISGMQQNISILLGISILLTLIIPFALTSQIQKYSPLNNVYIFVKRKFGMLLQKRGVVALFLMGLLNGLLPCGLVYTALIGATVVADVVQSGMFMFVFGLGTMPSLIAVSITGKLISTKFRAHLHRAVPVLSIVLAVILILRGMNLGIPLVSPKVTHTVSHQEKMDCCDE